MSILTMWSTQYEINLSNVIFTTITNNDLFIEPIDHQVQFVILKLIWTI